MKKPLHYTILLLTCFLYIHIGYSQTIYTVTSTSKDGPGSFLEAVANANANAGADIIEFTPNLQVDASFSGLLLPTNRVFAYITESVVIDGKGGALNGLQTWVSVDGEVNKLTSCPGDVLGTVQLKFMQTFLHIGLSGQDNSGVDVTVKNLSIKQFNSIASVKENASLVLENFKADDTWATYNCDAVPLLEAHPGSNLTIRNSLITNSYLWDVQGTATSIVGFPGAGDLIIEETTIAKTSKGDQYLIFWDGKPNSKVNIVSSRIMGSGGIISTGNAECNIVNSIWVNQYDFKPRHGDRIVNLSTEDMNIIGSSLMWNSNVCDSYCESLETGEFFLIDSKDNVTSNQGKVNFIESAIGINLPETTGTLIKILGDDSFGGGYTADEFTWIQPTLGQDATALKFITAQTNLRTNVPAFNSPVSTSEYFYDAVMVTPHITGELIDKIPSTSNLINPITSSPILVDVLGNPRNDANGDRDIGAVQLGLAPILSLGTIGDGFVDLSWSEPLHHNGIAVVRYEIEFEDEFGTTSEVVFAPTLNTTINGLTNGEEVSFKVRAVFENGGTGDNGPYSNIVSATPYGVFGTLNPAAVTCNEEVTLSWDLPDLGGRTFEQYIIFWRIDGTTTNIDGRVITDPNILSTIITGLTNGTAYEFLIRVKASGIDSNQESITITVGDTVPPVITCPGDIIVNNAPGQCDAIVDFTPTATDNCAGVTIASVPASGTVFPVGTTLVTVTATDAGGNTDICTFNVIVNDDEDPVIGCPGDVTAYTEDGECGAIVNFQNAVGIDNCGSVTVYQTAGFGSGSVFPVGDTLIEFTAQDDNGNLSTCTFTITVEDDDAPDAICQNITIQLDDMGNATITAGQINFGSNDNCGVDTLEIDMDTFDCSDVGDNNVILTVTDVNGNSSTCTAVVTVEDVTTPEVMCNDITVELDASGSVTIDPMDVAAGSSDACGIAAYELNIDTFGCLDVGTSTIILTVTDVNGNTSSCSATVTVEDNMAPELVCMDVTLELNEDGIAYIIPSELVDINDPCGVAVITADVDEVSCADIGTPVEVNIFANDGNGNSSFCSAMVTVVDTMGPQIVCPPNEQVNLGANGTYILGDYIGDGIATVSDNCTDPVTIFSQSPAAGTALGFGIQVITFTAEDEYGNVSTCSFNLNVGEILGANDAEDFASLVLYPNPADSQVNLSNPRQMDLSDITIYDLTGRIVNKVDLSNMGSEISIDVSTLANAPYLLVIKGSQGTSTKTLIVNNY